MLYKNLGKTHLHQNQFNFTLIVNKLRQAPLQFQARIVKGRQAILQRDVTFAIFNCTGIFSHVCNNLVTAEVKMVRK